MSNDDIPGAASSDGVAAATSPEWSGLASVVDAEAVGAASVDDISLEILPDADEYCGIWFEGLPCEGIADIGWPVLEVENEGADCDGELGDEV